LPAVPVSHFGRGRFIFIRMEIREANESDVAAILKLMRDFAAFEKLDQYFEATEERMREALFGIDAVAQALLAESNGVPAGYAIFFPYFATFRGQKGYYLEDLYVDPAFRGAGVGEAMIRRIAAKGRERGFERIDFQVLEWNAPAITFYEKLGAERDDTERHFKFTDEAFRRLAE
jgi:GNAT superfamily N-acetyltransferase